MFYTMNSSPLLVTKLDVMLIIILSNNQYYSSPRWLVWDLDKETDEPHLKAQSS